MASQNLVSQTIAAADITAAKTAINTLEGILGKYLLNLTKEQRKRLPKISTEDRALATDALTVVQNDASFMPQSFSVTEFGNDAKFFEDLYGLYVLLLPIVEKMDGTLMATRSDLDSEMRDVYASAKRNGVTAGLERLTAYFGQRYRRARKGGSSGSGGTSGTQPSK